MNTPDHYLRPRTSFIDKKTNCLNQLRSKRRDEIMSRKRLQHQTNLVEQYSIKNSTITTSWDFYQTCQQCTTSEIAIQLTLFGLNVIEKLKCIEEIKDIIVGFVKLLKFRETYELFATQKVLNQYIFSQTCHEEVLYIIRTLLSYNMYNLQQANEIGKYLKSSNNSNCYSLLCDVFVSSNNEIFNLWLKSGVVDNFFQNLSQIYSTEVMDIISPSFTTNLNDFFETNDNDDSRIEDLINIPPMDDGKNDLFVNILYLIEKYPFIIERYQTICFSILLRFNPQSNDEVALFESTMNILIQNGFEEFVYVLIKGNTFLIDYGTFWLDR
ncbi:Rab-GAP TBC domain-containing protein [Entamoeba marina]